MRHHEVDRIADLPDGELRKLADGSRPTGLWSQAPRAAEWELAERRRERIRQENVIREREQLLLGAGVVLLILLVLFSA